MSQRLGRIEVSTKLLEEWMALPEGSRIRKVSDANTLRSLYFEVIVESPDLPEVADGDVIPLIVYTMNRGVVKGKFRL